MTEEEDRLRHEQYSIARAEREAQLLRDNPGQLFSEEPEKFIKHLLIRLARINARLDYVDQFLANRFPNYTPPEK